MVAFNFPLTSITHPVSSEVSEMKIPETLIIFQETVGKLKASLKQEIKSQEKQ